MYLFRSRIIAVALLVRVNVIMPVMHSAQRIPNTSIIAPIDQVKSAPPNPDPELEMPLAMLRRDSNHCDKMGKLGMYMKPIPKPTGMGAHWILVSLRAERNLEPNPSFFCGLLGEW